MAADLNTYTRKDGISVFVSLPYAMFAIELMSYPLSGFIADVCCGRFKTVITGLIFLGVGLLLITVVSSLLLVFLSIRDFTVFKGVDNVWYALLSIPFLLFAIGQSGYQANFIQFGLDQLLEAPSEYLGLFIHWATWAYTLMFAVLIIPSMLLTCYYRYDSVPSKVLMSVTILGILVIAIISFCLLLTVSIRKRHWFYVEPRQHNPYKVVISVLNFARKHTHPLQRSAFTYTDDVIPTRIDFAKDRFGGPFTTEQVEDVKTFLRILLVLLSLGPIQFLQVPASLFIFPVFGLHVGHFIKFQAKHCNVEWVALRSVNNISTISAYWSI